MVFDWVLIIKGYFDVCFVILVDVGINFVDELGSG